VASQSSSAYGEPLATTQALKPAKSINLAEFADSANCKMWLSFVNPDDSVTTLGIVPA
jgi:hypothetical protein